MRHCCEEADATGICAGLDAAGLRGRSLFWAPSEVQRSIAGGSPAAAYAGTGTSSGEVQAARVLTATGSALHAGTAKKPHQMKASRVALEQGKATEVSIQGGP